jgi:hypothetical protein
MEVCVRSWLGLRLFAESHKYNHHHKSLVIGQTTLFLHMVHTPFGTPNLTSTPRIPNTEEARFVNGRRNTRGRRVSFIPNMDVIWAIAKVSYRSTTREDFERNKVER